MLNQIKYLSSSVFSFDYDMYLKDAGRELVGLKINAIEKRYEYWFGPNDSEFLDLCNLNYFESKAGYAVDVSTKLKTDKKYDVLSMSSEIISKPDIEFDTLIIHELVHLLIDSDNMSNIDFSISEPATKLGEQIYKITDQVHEHITRHTQEFCIYLAEASIRYFARIEKFNSPESIINSAMRYDVFNFEE